MAKKEKRFVFQKAEETALGFGSSAQVVVDRQTGVNYLYVSAGYGGGLCPLLDRDGRPIITPVVDLED